MQSIKRPKDPGPLIPAYAAAIDAAGMVICSWHTAPRVLEHLGWTGRSVRQVVGWQDPAAAAADFPPLPRQLPVHVERANDREHPEAEGAPTLDQVRRLLDAARPAEPGLLMVCCHAAVARSTATALAIMVARHGAGEADLLVERILALRPGAAPNRLILRHAEAVLGIRGEALLAAVRRSPTMQENLMRPDPLD